MKYQVRVFRVFMAGLLLLSMVLLMFSAQPAAADSHWVVIAEGLDNPRGLTVSADGSVLVAEAGVGGEGPCAPSPEGGLACYGASGAVTRIWDGGQARILTGLPSLADESGMAASGPSDVAMRNSQVGWVITGLGADPTLREPVFGEVGLHFGRQVFFLPNGKYMYDADVSAYEAEANPDGGLIDSNPYSVAALSGSRTIVADAGANALLLVVKRKVSTLAVFPDRLVDAPEFLGLPPGTQIPMQSVPNSVVVGPDGAYYVGELTGFPFPVGEARVYRVMPGQEPEVYAEGFTNIIDLAFDPEGHLYVLEIVKNGLIGAEMTGDFTGALIRVEADGSHTEVASEGLITPAGLAIGRDGGIYISNFGIFAGAGQVIRLGGDTSAPTRSAQPITGANIRLPASVDLTVVIPRMVGR
jgi:hypothetical protein